MIIKLNTVKIIKEVSRTAFAEKNTFSRVIPDKTRYTRKSKHRKSYSQYV